MSTLRSLTTGARPLRRLAALALAGLALSLALIVGSSPAHAAGRPAAAPSQTTKAPPGLSPHTREMLVSRLDRSLSKLGKRPTLRQLKALGLRPDPKRLAARFNKLAHSTRARAADVGSTYWFTYHYYGHVWADVYYDGPWGGADGVVISYGVYSNYKMCDWTADNGKCADQGCADSSECIDLNEFTYLVNIDINGTYYYDSPASGYQSPDSAGMPEYGQGPESDCAYFQNCPASPAHAARRAAAPSQTTKPPPVISPRTREALVSQLNRSLSKLGKRPTVQQLKARGLRPDPERLAARFKKLAQSTRARAADAGSTYWFTYQYYGHFWADVYYIGPFVDASGDYYMVYNNYKLCDWQGNNCINPNVFTSIYNVDIGGHYYYDSPASGYTLDSAGMPEYGQGPFPNSFGY